MDPYHDRIGRDRALVLATSMWLTAATIGGAMSYPLWDGVGEASAIGLLAMAEGQIDPFDSAARDIARDVITSHGVRRRPGQSWMHVFQSLSPSKVGGIGEDLRKRLGASRENPSTSSRGRQSKRSANVGRGRARRVAGGAFAMAVARAPWVTGAPWARAPRRR